MRSRTTDVYCEAVYATLHLKSHYWGVDLAVFCTAEPETVKNRMELFSVLGVAIKHSDVNFNKQHSVKERDPLVVCGLVKKDLTDS